jgi:hypothetical protein
VLVVAVNIENVYVLLDPSAFIRTSKLLTYWDFDSDEAK